MSIQRNINPKLKHNAREEKIFTSVDYKIFVNLPNFTLIIVITITNSFVSVDLKFDEFLRELFEKKFSQHEESFISHVPT